MNLTPSLSTAAAATSVSLAIVVVLQWLLALAHIDLPADVQTALGTILTNLIHWIMIKEHIPDIPPKPEV